MRFCTQCHNMYYIRLSNEDGQALIYYCRNCGHSENISETNIENLCIAKTNITSNKNPYQHIVNKFTKMDPTLPRIKNMKCPNKDCSSNAPVGKKQEHIDPEIIYLRYDDKNMKYIYLCANCDITWLSTDNK